jgi:hypothetical protein
MSDLTAPEQANVRTALRFLRTRCGGWAQVSKAVRSKHGTLASILSGKAVSASLAVRLAWFAEVGVDDVLTGAFPPAGACPHCGHCP